MSNVAEIERIAALVERLLPLRDRRPGELIEADDWNVVVKALLEVARAVVTEAETAVAPHSHADQVTAAWLDPVLRARLEKGPLTDPGSVARVAKLERTIHALRANIDGVAGDLTGVRAAANRLEAADLARESNLTRVTRKVDGLDDARDAVTDVRSTLAVLQTDLDRVSTLARDLEVDGDTISISSLVDRLGALEGLRTRLTGPDGEELNATTFALRLAELENTLVTEEELDEALGNVRDDSISDELRERLVADARTAAREQADASNTELEGRLTTDINARLAAAESAATAAAATRAEEIGGQLADQLRAELTADISAGDDAVRGTIDEALSSLTTTIRTEVDGQLGLLRGDLEANISDGLGNLREELRATIDESITSLTSRVDPLAGQIAAAEKASATASARAEELARELARTRTTLTDLVEERVAAARAASRADAFAADSKVTSGMRAEMAAERQRVDRALAEMQKRIPRLVDERVTTARTEIERDLDARIDETRTSLDELLRRTERITRPDLRRPQ